MTEQSLNEVTEPLNKEERYFLQSLQGRLASRKELIEKYGLSDRFIYKNSHMPAPVMTVSLYNRGLHLFDIQEVREAQEKYARRIKGWTTTEIQRLTRWRRAGQSYAQIAHVLGRTEEAVANKYNKLIKEAKAEAGLK